MKSMDTKANIKKSEQLGEPYGTASAKLRKSILFSLLKELNRLSCFRCKQPILQQDLSIDHMKPWLDSENPKQLFNDLSNISFSHLRCNSAASRVTNKKYFTEKDRKAAILVQVRNSHRKIYTTEKRRAKYLRTGT